MDACDGCVVNQRNAIPQQIARGRFNQQRALADGESRRGSKASQSRLFGLTGVGVRFAQVFQRGPRLSIESHVLPFIAANGAGGRRFVTLRVLRAARTANVFHSLWMPASWSWSQPSLAECRLESVPSRFTLKSCGKRHTLNR